MVVAVNKIGGNQKAGKGNLSIVKSYDIMKMRDDYIRDDINGHYLKSRDDLLFKNKSKNKSLQTNILEFIRDNINKEFPRWWYNLVLGHDLHVSVWAELYVQHYHTNQVDPFTGYQGWLENIGLVSKGKVTTAFRNNIVDNLVSDTTAFGDYKFHEVGTDATAEANTQTALIVPSGIARATGTQVEAAVDQYQSVATITADATETWQEHGIFNISTAGVMMDRSLISPTVSVVASDQVTFTYTITVNAEA